MKTILSASFILTILVCITISVGARNHSDNAKVTSSKRYIFALPSIWSGSFLCFRDTIIKA
jgi:hypothetical protein